jgi:hypothetical protein
LIRFVAVCCAVVVVELLVVRVVASGLQSFWLTEGLYYGALLVGGSVLAVWARVEAPWGAVMGTAAIAAIAVVSLVQFFTDPGVNFQYGPETWIFALQRHLGIMNMWPVDAAAAASATAVAGACRARARPV